jgi:hypothetical protein
MAPLLVLVAITLVLRHGLLGPLGAGLTAVLNGSWAPWALLLLGLWLVSGPGSRRL